MEHLEAFIKHVESLVNLKPEERAFIEENVPIEHFKRGEFLLKEGEIMRNWYFTIKGCVRMFYNAGGEERTTYFYEEGVVINSWKSFMTQQPSIQNLQCLEDSIFAVVSYKLDMEGFSRFHSFDTAARLQSRVELIIYDDIVLSLLTKTPEERYIHWVERHPNLIQRITQKQLATFLGIRPESLSRIRRRIAQKK